MKVSIDDIEARPVLKTLANDLFSVKLTESQLSDLRILENENRGVYRNHYLETFYYLSEGNLSVARDTIKACEKGYTELVLQWEKENSTEFEDDFGSLTSSNLSTEDYSVSFVLRQFGLIIENILERTFIRSVQDNSEGSRLGVKPNSLLISIDTTSTLSQTHAETLDLLKKAMRPLKLTFRKANSDYVDAKRMEMKGLAHFKTEDFDGNQAVLDIESRLRWILRMYLCIFCTKVDKTVPPTPTYDDMDSSIPPPPPMRDSFTDVPDYTIHYVKPCPPASSPMTRKRLNSMDDDTDKIHDGLELLIAFEKQILVNKTNEVLPFTRFLSMLECLSALHCELDDECLPPRILKLLDKIIIDICYRILLIDPHTIQGCEDSFDSTSISSGVVFLLLQFLITKFDTVKVCKIGIPTIWHLGCANSFLSKVVSCNLTPCIYHKLSFAQQLRLRGLLNRHLTDDNPDVRSRVIKTINAVIGGKTDVEWMMHCITVSSEDQSASVRVSVFELLVYLIRTEVENREASKVEEGTEVFDAEIHLIFCRLHPIICKLAEDSDSNVRCLVASKCDLLCKYMGLKWSSIILDMILVMLRDKFAYVRAAAVRTIPSLLLNVVKHFNRKYSQEDSAKTNSSGGFMRESLSRLKRRTNNVWMMDNSKGVSKQVEAVVSASTPDSDTAKRLETMNLLSRIRDNILSAVLPLKLDSDIDVKIAVATSVPELLNAVCRLNVVDMEWADNAIGNDEVAKAPIISCKNIKIGIAKVLVASILELLNDNGQSHQVPYAVLEQLLVLRNISSFIFTSSNSSLLISCITPLAVDRNWRMRKAVCSAIPFIVSACKTVETRSSAASLIIPLLRDTVFEVRKAAATAICLASNCDLEKDGRSMHMLYTAQFSSKQDIYVSSRSSIVFRNEVADAINRSRVSSDMSDVGKRLSVDESIEKFDEDPTLLLSEDMGRMWLDSVVLQQLLLLSESTKFQERILMLHMICVLFLEEVVDVDDARWILILRIGLSIYHDAVPNVRLALAVMLRSIIPCFLCKLQYDVQNPSTKATGIDVIFEVQSGSETIVANAKYSVWLGEVKSVLKTLCDDNSRDIATSARDIVREYPWITQVDIPKVI